MARLLLGLGLIVLPFAELMLIIKTGQIIGFWPTLAVLVAGAAIGSAIISRQGLTIVRRTQEAVARGRPPGGPVLDGAFTVLAGALLITPGFITDAIALLLLVPPLRRKVARALVRFLIERAQAQVKVYHVRGQDGGQGGGQGDSEPAGPAQSAAGQGTGSIIEGEFVRLGESPQRGEGGDQTRSRLR
jgi:UPF0716 protein FxsA